MYKVPIDGEFESYNDYINSKDLDTDLIGLHLWLGDRTPQNDFEREYKKELDEMREKGKTPVFYFE